MITCDYCGVKYPESLFYDDRCMKCAGQDKNVVGIEEYKPHSVAEVICVKCLSRYVCVYPSDVLLKDLDCDNCGPGFVITTGQTLEEE